MTFLDTNLLLNRITYKVHPEEPFVSFISMKHVIF